LSARQRFVVFGIQFGIGTRKCDASRALVASRKTIHFQQHGFVVWMISNWTALYSMAAPQAAALYGVNLVARFN
jgi:hypothetical protein